MGTSKKMICVSCMEEKAEDRVLIGNWFLPCCEECRKDPIAVLEKVSKNMDAVIKEMSENI